MKHYFQFLFRFVDHDRTMALKFYEELLATLPQCSPQAEVNLYTAVDGGETTIGDKLESCFMECSDNALPILKHLLRSYPVVEVEPPPEPLPSLLLVAGTVGFTGR
jgi:hypothetical protein